MKNVLTLLSLFSLLLPLSSHGYGPARQQVEQTINIAAPAAEVWAVIAQFDQIHQWHPEVQTTQSPTPETRQLTLNTPVAPTLTEKLVKSDAEAMALTYRITDMSTTRTSEFNKRTIQYTALPVTNYKSWLMVTPINDQQTKVTWRGKFYRAHMANPPIPQGQSDQDAINAVTDYYQIGLTGLKQMLEQ